MASDVTDSGLREHAYDSPSWWYDLRGLFILTFAYRSTLTRQIRFFAANVGARHLEVAIGSGALFELVLLWRRLRGLPRSTICGFDYSDAMLDGAHRRFARTRDIELSRGDATALVFADAAFDSLNIANAVHCFADVDAALRESHRVLAAKGTIAVNALLYPNGSGPLKLIASRINAWGIRKGILTSPLDPDDFSRRVERAGFVIIEANRHGNALELLARKE